ncbi:MAG TPA: lasso peptide biosynthesis B2 protein [Blastocatellia bacterium]
MNRWRKFRQLSLTEQSTFIQAVFMLPFMALALRLIGLTRCQAALSRSLRSYEAQSKMPVDIIQQARATARMLSLANRNGLYKANCLQRSVALWWLLGRQGIESSVSVGVRKRADKLEAHAWVECSGVVLNDRDDIHESYAPFDRAVISGSNQSL